jgi:hypothetical protein
MLSALVLPPLNGQPVAGTHLSNGILQRKLLLEQEDKLAVVG